MSYCPKCGNQVPDGAKFCPKCGQNLEAMSIEPEAAREPVREEPVAEAEATPKPKKNNNLAVTIVCMIGILVISLCYYFLITKNANGNKPLIIMIPIICSLYVFWPIIFFIDGIKQKRVPFIVVGALGITEALILIPFNFTAMAATLALLEATA